MPPFTLRSRSIWDTIIFLHKQFGFFFFHMHLMDFCRKIFILKFAATTKTLHCACDGNIFRDGLVWVFRASVLIEPELNFTAVLKWRLYAKVCRAFFSAFNFLYLGNSKSKRPKRASIQREVISRCGFGNDRLADCTGILRMETSGQHSNTCLPPAWLRRPRLVESRLMSAFTARWWHISVLPLMTTEQANAAALSRGIQQSTR